MKLLQTIDAWGKRGRLELLLGDLSNTPEEHSTDVLVVSAFPNDYTPTSTSLIGALHRSGLSVADLAASKAYDLRDNFGCWLSHELTPKPGLPFKRVLCFEPEHRGQSPQFVADIFRALEPFSHAAPFLTSVAMPLVTAGNQGVEIDAVGAALVDAAWNRLKEDHPIRLIKIVAFSQQDSNRVASFFNRDPYFRPGEVASILGRSPQGPTAARSALERMIDKAQPKQPELEVLPTAHRRVDLAPLDDAAGDGYDAFVSYSRQDQASAQLVAEQLKANGLRVFIDQLEIELGFAWQRKIFEALERCRCVVALYSPEFVQSKVCQDEFAAAMILRRRPDNEGFILPLLVRDTQLPAYMEMLNYSDCREADAEKLRASALRIARRFGNSMKA